MGTLYIGVTNNISARVYQHKKGEVDGFTKKYKIDKLVYAEECNNIEAALAREKALKKWERAWKVKLIEAANPDWDDLYEVII